STMSSSAPARSRSADSTPSCERAGSPRTSSAVRPWRPKSMPSGRSAKAPSWPPSSSRSGLLERLDLQGDGDLVADHGATGLQRHVDVDAEVLAVQDDRCLEAGNLTVAHARVDAVELQL